MIETLRLDYILYLHEMPSLKHASSILRTLPDFKIKFLREFLYVCAVPPTPRTGDAHNFRVEAEKSQLQRQKRSRTTLSDFSYWYHQIRKRNTNWAISSYLTPKDLRNLALFHPTPMAFMQETRRRWDRKNKSLFITVCLSVGLSGEHEGVCV